MDAPTRIFVQQRSGNRCEYCGMPQDATPFIPFHVEHIIARQHVEADSNDPSRLAFSCDRCNAYKGPNISSVDPATGEVVQLFNPRTDVWSDHFVASKGFVIGLSSVGRATSRLLNMNHPRRVELRLQWLEEGREN